MRIYAQSWDSMYSDLRMSDHLELSMLDALLNRA